MTAGGSVPEGKTSAPNDGALASPRVWNQAACDSDEVADWFGALQAAGFALDIDAHGEPGGVAASVDPAAGDPQLLAVYLGDSDQDAWRVDRRTMRLNHVPEPARNGADFRALEDHVVGGADLADRVQLELGRPLLVRWSVLEGRPAVCDLRPLSPAFRFTNASYRRTAPLTADPGTLATLSVDAVERALSFERERAEEPRVRRLFGQAYRRIDDRHTPWSTYPSTRPQKSRVLRLGRKAAHLTRDVTLALADARRFERALGPALMARDAEVLASLDTEDLLDSIRARAGHVIDALVLLERSRLATLSLLPALRLMLGDVPRDTFRALAALERTPPRRELDARLVALAQRCIEEQGRVAPPRDRHGVLRREWDRLRTSLARTRVLGMDVRPAPLDSDDAHLTQGLQEALAEQRLGREQARTNAQRQLRVLARSSPLSAASAPAVETIIALLRRLAQAKGAVAEGLSGALLRLRDGALEAGQRLRTDGIIDVAPDAFYLALDELEDALRGELGAYAARIRLRREDERRWRCYEPPHRIHGRRL